MNNHDELSYLKIIAKINEEMSKENEQLKRELIIHRIAIIILFVISVLGLV